MTWWSIFYWAETFPQAVIEAPVCLADICWATGWRNAVNNACPTWHESVLVLNASFCDWTSRQVSVKKESVDQTKERTNKKKVHSCVLSYACTAQSEKGLLEDTMSPLHFRLCKAVNHEHSGHAEASSAKYRKRCPPCIVGIVYRVLFACDSVWIGKCLNDHLQEHFTLTKSDTAGHLVVHVWDCGCSPQWNQVTVRLVTKKQEEERWLRSLMLIELVIQQLVSPFHPKRSAPSFIYRPSPATVWPHGNMGKEWKGGC